MFIQMQFLLLSFGCLFVFFSLTDARSYNAQPSNVLKRGYRPSSAAEFRPVNDDNDCRNYLNIYFSKSLTSDAVGGGQSEATYSNENYIAVDVAPAPDNNYGKEVAIR